jgi:hypothetical protein
MPPPDKIIDLENDIQIVKSGTEVIVLDRRSLGVQVLHNGLTKWIHNVDTEAIR